MSTGTITRPSGTLSAKAPRISVQNAVSLRDLRAYFRAELRLSKRDSAFMAHEVYRDEATSATNLPAGWHAAIWPATVTFERRTPGISDPTPKQAIRNIEKEAA